MVLGLLGVFCLMSCDKTGSAKMEGTEETVQGVRSERISDIIRMPVSADGTVDSSKMPIFTFEETKFDFDTVFTGDIVEHTFKFKNTGKTSLLINDVRTGCGCTTPVWPKDPVPPGESSEVIVRFDTKGRSGRQTKSVTLFANTYPNTTVLRVFGVVLSPENN